jgi:hypothetical protein
VPYGGLHDVGLLKTLTIAVDTARMLTSNAVETAVAAARLADDARFVGWRAAGLWEGYFGLAVLAATLDDVEPGCGLGRCRFRPSASRG